MSIPTTDIVLLLAPAWCSAQGKPWRRCNQTEDRNSGMHASREWEQCCCAAAIFTPRQFSLDWHPASRNGLRYSGGSEQECCMTAKGVAPNRDRLARLLTEAGSEIDPDGVAELIAGVLAAPPEIGTSWHALVADPTLPALAEALEGMRAWLAEDWRDGLAPEDFV